MSEATTFDSNDHCVNPGWATYMQRPMPRWRLRCAFGNHALPAHKPQNDFSPQAYGRCCRCQSALRYYNEGTHRYGGLSRYFAALGITTEDTV